MSTKKVIEALFSKTPKKVALSRYMDAVDSARAELSTMASHMEDLDIALSNASEYGARSYASLTDNYGFIEIQDIKNELDDIGIEVSVDMLNRFNLLRDVYEGDIEPMLMELGDHIDTAANLSYDITKKINKALGDV